jgi:hypothetical protein
MLLQIQQVPAAYRHLLGTEQHVAVHMYGTCAS